MIFPSRRMSFRIVLKVQRAEKLSAEKAVYSREQICYTESWDKESIGTKERNVKW